MNYGQRFMTLYRRQGSRPSPRKINEKAKWLSEEALQIAVKRREVKSKGEKERYKPLNADFQRIAKREKKAFLSDQCKEIEENNRMGKNKDLFKKIRDTKGTFRAKMGSIKDRNCMDLTEAEDIKKRWQEYTEKLYKKDLHDPDNHDGVITHLEPDILECKVKWTLGTITMNRARDSGLKHICCRSLFLLQAPGLFYSLRFNAKECSNYHTTAHISYTSKVMLKILQARLQQLNYDLRDVQTGFRKGRGTNLNCQHLLDHQNSKRVPEKHLFLLY